MKVFKSIMTFSVLSLFLLSSCTDAILDKINENPNNLLDAQSRFIMPELITSTGFSVTGGDFSLYASIYVEHEAGIHNQMWYAETRGGEPTSATTYNNVWGAVWENVKNAKIVIKKCSPDGSEEGNNVTLGAAQIMLAYNMAMATDLFGDVPYTEAGEIDEATGSPVSMQPKVDKQEDIYKDIFRLLDEAIVNLDKGDLIAGMGTRDFAYQGNAARWKQLAYGLKARYTMRLMKRSSNVNTDMNNVLDYVSKSFKNAADEFKLDIYDGDANLNPLLAFSYSREALAASQSLVDKLAERDDPRLYQGFMDICVWGDQIEDPDDIDAAPNGNPAQLQGRYSASIFTSSITAPTLMMSYHELKFLEAEALCRLNRKADAETALKSALTAAFASQQRAIASAVYEWIGGGVADLGTSVADAYFTGSVKPLFDANPLKETMMQKYLAFWGAGGESIEAYNDYRRLRSLGENHVTLANPNNASKFPLRYTYGNSDVVANMNIKPLYGDGFYVYTENVWWAGGTR